MREVTLDNVAMLHSRILVDLPSEEGERAVTLLEWLRSLTGQEIDLRSGREALTLSGLWVVKAIMASLGRAGIDNAIALHVDGSPVFIDTEGRDDDASLLAEAAREWDLDQESFATLALAFEQKSEQLHAIVEMVVSREVRAGQKELMVQLAAQVPELLHRPGESARAYVARLREAAGSATTLREGLEALERLTSRIAREFQAQFDVHGVQQGPAEAILVCPEALDETALGQLDFSGQLVPRYRPEQGAGELHPDPFHRYYRDPCYELRSAVLLSEVLVEPAWQSADLFVVRESGEGVAAGNELGAAASQLAVASVTVDEDGRLRVTAPARTE